MPAKGNSRKMVKIAPRFILRDVLSTVAIVAAWTPYYRKLMGRIPLQIEISGLSTSQIAERYITVLSQQHRRIFSENGLLFLFHSPFSFKDSLNWLWSILVVSTTPDILGLRNPKENERCATYFYQDKGLLYFLEVYCAFLRNQTRKNIHFIGWITVVE